MRDVKKDLLGSLSEFPVRKSRATANANVSKIHCRRIRNTRDHKEFLEVRKALNLDGMKLPPNEKWSTRLGQGFGRRLSNRRQNSQKPRMLKRRNTLMAEVTAMEDLEEVDGEES